MQLDMFSYECQTPYRVKKPIRLIELFAGKGAQAKALERKKANFVHWRICEFDKHAVATYNAIHGTNFETSDITQITAEDLGITDTDKYEYIMTYSFPCTDLSIAGKQKGMSKGSGTRSGLLWEVERLLKECKELPQVLLMENVPQVLNCDFGVWLEFLEGLGYRNYYQKLNAKDYGIPQNRDRVFMVSTLGDYYYDFPKPIPLKLRLKDMLEPTVDEKYYLSEKVIANLQLNKDISNAVRSGGRGSTDRHSWDLVEEKVECVGEVTPNSQAGKVYGTNGLCPTIMAGTHGYAQGYIKEPVCNVIGNLNGTFESTGRIHGIDGLCPTINTMGGGQRESKMLEPIIWGSQQKHCAKSTNGICPTLTEAMGMGGGQVPLHNYGYCIRKLTPLECFRLMGFDDADFYKAKAAGISDSQLYKIAGNSIVVQVLEHIFEMILKEDL